MTTFLRQFFTSTLPKVRLNISISSSSLLAEKARSMARMSSMPCCYSLISLCSLLVVLSLLFLHDPCPPSTATTVGLPPPTFTPHFLVRKMELTGSVSMMILLGAIVSVFSGGVKLKMLLLYQCSECCLLHGSRTLRYVCTIR